MVMALAGLCVEVAEAAGYLALTAAVWHTTACKAVPQGGAR
jgi:hypothetical protein